VQYAGDFNDFFPHGPAGVYGNQSLNYEWYGANPQPFAYLMTKYSSAGHTNNAINSPNTFTCPTSTKGFGIVFAIGHNTNDGQDVGKCLGQNVRLTKLAAGPKGPKAVAFDIIPETGASATYTARACHGSEGGNVLAGDGSAQWVPVKSWVLDGHIDNVALPSREYYIFNTSTHGVIPDNVYTDKPGQYFQ
jgi:hypothetical protein